MGKLMACTVQVTLLLSGGLPCNVCKMTRQDVGWYTCTEQPGYANMCVQIFRRMPAADHPCVHACYVTNSTIHLYISYKIGLPAARRL